MDMKINHIDPLLLDQDIFLTFLFGLNLIDWCSIVIAIMFQAFLFSIGMIFNKKIILFSAIAVYMGMILFFFSVLLSDVKLTSNAFLKILDFGNFINKDNIGPLITVTGTIFAYFFLVPAALKFFIAYGADVVEPFWSFDQYFDFVAVLLFATGLAFQVPAIQVVLGLLGIVTGEKMLSAWKYVIVICTIAAAIITPSTDPITQLLLSFSLLTLYLGGSGIVLILEKKVL